MESRARVISEADTILDQFDSEKTRFRDVQDEIPDRKFVFSSELKRDTQMVFAYLPGM